MKERKKGFMCFRRYIAFALVVAMVLTIAPVNISGNYVSADAATYNGINTDITLEEGDTLSGNIDNCTINVPKGVTAYVTGPVTISGTVNLVGGGTLVRNLAFADSMIKVPYGNTLNIGESDKDNGVTIDGNKMSISNINGGAFAIGGSLNTYNGTVIKNNSISINSASVYGGGAIWVKSGASFNMNNGIISNNNVTISNEYLDNKGGGAVLVHGSMSLKDGQIVDNSCNSCGGAVFIDNSGNVNTNPVFAMNGGIISGNTAGVSGGGIKVKGVSFTLGGSARVTCNTANNMQNNVCIDPAFIPEVTQRFSGSVGISGSNNAEVFASLNNLVSESFTSKEALRFFFDNSNLVGSKSDNTLVWIAGTAIDNCQASLAGTVVTAITSPENSTAKFQWFRNDSNSATGGTAITGAYEASYTIVPEDIGKYIYAVADGSDGYTGHKYSNTVYVDNNTYTSVEFDSQGHGVAIAPIAAVIGQAIVAPSAPFEEGYVFNNWFPDKSCINAWNFGTDVINGSTVLYADWNTAPTATPEPPEKPAVKDTYYCNDYYKMKYSSDYNITEMWYCANGNGTSPSANWVHQYYQGNNFGYSLLFKCNGKTYNYHSQYFNHANVTGTSVSLSSATSGYSATTADNMFRIQWKDLAIGSTGKHVTFSLENVLSENGISKNFSLSTADATGEYEISDIKLSYGGDTTFSGSDIGYSYRINTDGIAMAYLKQNITGSNNGLVMSLTSSDADSVYAGNYLDGKLRACAFNNTNYAYNGTLEGDGNETATIDNGYYMCWDNIGILSSGNIVTANCLESISNNGAVCAIPAGTQDFAAAKNETQSSLINAFALVNFGSEPADVMGVKVGISGTGVKASANERSYYVKSRDAVIVPVTVDVAANTGVGTHILSFDGEIGEKNIHSSNSIRVKYPTPSLVASINGGTINYTVNNATEVYLMRTTGENVESRIDGLSSANGSHTYTLKQGGSYVLCAANPSNEVAHYDIGTLYKVNASVLKGGGGSVSADSYVAEGQSITLTSTSVDNYSFDKWYTDAYGTNALETSSTLSVGTGTTTDNITTIVLSGIKQDINVFAGFKQNDIGDLQSSKVYVYYTDNNEEKLLGYYENLTEAYACVQALTDIQKDSVRYILTGNQVLNGTVSEPVIFNLDDGQIITGNAGCYSITVSDYATLNIGNETISNTCNSRTGIWHTGSGQVNGENTEAKGANVASGAKIILNGGDVNFDGQRSVIQNSVELYPDNSVNLVSDLNTDNYLQLTILDSTGAVKVAGELLDWTSDILATTDGTDGDDSTSDVAQNEDYNLMSGRVKVTNDEPVVLSSEYNVSGNNDTLNFKCTSANDIKAMVMPFNDSSSDFYDVRYIMQYDSINTALNNVKYSNIGTLNTAADNTIYLVNNVVGDILLSGDDPTQDGIYTYFRDYGSNTYNNSVKIVSATRNSNEKLTIITDPNEFKTINGNVTLKTITDTINVGLYNAGNFYKAGTNWLLDNVKVNGKVIIEKNSKITVTKDKVWSANEVISLAPSNADLGSVLVTFDNCNVDISKFSLTPDLTEQGFVLGAKDNNIIITKKLSALNNFKLTGVKGSSVGSNVMTLVINGSDNFINLNADTDVTSWFDNIPTGVSAKIVDTVNAYNIVHIAFYGTPSVVSSEAIHIAIPGINNSTEKSISDTLYNADYSIINAVYTVSYDANSGSGSMDTTTVSQGDVIPLPECMFTQPEADCRFAGWAKGTLTGDVLQPDDSFTPGSNITFLALWKSTKVPSSVQINDIKVGSTSINLINAQATQNYALVDSSNNLVTGWMTPSDGKVVFDGLTAETEYGIVTRNAAYKKIMASDSSEKTIVTTLPCGATPSGIVDYVKEKVSGLVVNAQYTVNSELFTANSEGIIDINDKWFGTTISIVKLGDNTTVGESLPQNIILQARPSALAPFALDMISKTGTTISVNTINSNNVRFKLIDIDNNLIFDWKDPVNNSVVFNGLSENTIYKIITKVKATSLIPASYENEGTAVRTIRNCATPNGVIDYSLDVIKGLLSDTVYIINGIEYTSDENGFINAKEEWFGSTISISMKGDGIIYANSNEQQISLIAKSNAPESININDISRTTSTITVDNAIATQQYAVKDADGNIVGPWVMSISTELSFTGLQEGTTFYVVTRIPPQTDIPASLSSAGTAVTTQQKEGIPEGVINYRDEAITGLNPSQVYIINGTEYTSYSTGRIDMQNEWMGVSLSIIKKAANTSYVNSDAQVISVAGRPVTPGAVLSANISQQLNKITIKNVDNDQQYKLTDIDGDVINWTSPTDGLVVFSGISEGKQYNIVNRIAATDTNSISEISSGIQITSLFKETTPSAAIDYVNECITGLVSNSDYIINSGAWSSDSLGNIVVNDSWFGSAISVIKKGNGLTTGDSVAQSISINARAQKPLRISMNSLIKGAKQIIVRPAVATQEYKIMSENGEPASEWLTPENEMVIFDNLLPGTTYKAVTRVKAIVDCAESYESASTLITTYGLESTPEGVVNYPDEMITGLKVGVDYIIEDTNYVPDSNGCVPIDESWFGKIISIVQEGNGVTTVYSEEQHLSVNSRAPVPDEVSTNNITISTNSLTLNSAIDTQEYKLLDENNNKLTEWLRPVDGKVIFDVLNEDTLYIVITRKLANETASKSNATVGTEVVTMYHEDKPQAFIDYNNEKIMGLEQGADYKINGTLYTADVDGKVTISESWFENDLSIIKAGDGSSTVDSTEQTIHISSRPAAPSTESFMAYGTLDSIIVNADPALEYQLFNAKGVLVDWISVDTAGNTALFSKLQNKTSYSFAARVKATNSAPKSLVSDDVTVSTLFLENTPLASVDYINEYLLNLVPNNKYVVNNNDYTSDASGRIIIDDSWYGTNILIQKTGNGSTSVNSIPQDISIEARPVTPAEVSTDDIIIGTNSIKINADASQEYELLYTTGGKAKNWTSPVNHVIEFADLYENTQYILITREKALSTIPASKMTNGTNITTMYYEATPEGRINYLGRCISGLVANENYVVNGIDSTADVNGNVNVSDNWFGSPIVIIKKGKDKTTVNSASQSIDTIAKPVKPAEVSLSDIVCTATTITINPADETHEYKLINMSGTDVTAWASQINGKVVFENLDYNSEFKVVTRMLPTENTPQSESSEGTATKTLDYRTTPSGIVDYVNEKITNLSPGTVYIINDTEYTTDSEGKVAIHEEWFDTSVSIVLTGDNIVFANSIPQMLSIAPRAAIPAKVNIDKIIKGTNTIAVNSEDDSQEYRLTKLDGTEVACWVTPTGGKVDFTGLVEGETYKVVNRTKGTVNASKSLESKGTSVTTYITELTPNGIVDYLTMSIKGLSPDKMYVINNGEYKADIDGTITINEEWIGNTVQIVKVGSGSTTVDSAAQSMSIADKPVAPEPVSIDNIIKGSMSITVNSADNSQEYAVTDNMGNTVISWTSPDEGKVIFTGLNEGTDYIVNTRNKATVSAPSSYVAVGVVITTLHADVKPTGVVNYKTEEITGLTANADYSVNGTETTAYADGKIIISEAWFGTTIHLVKKGDGVITGDSVPQDISISARQTTPGAVDNINIILGIDAITINSANELNEYKLTNEVEGDVNEWTTPAAGKVIFTELTEGTEYNVVVRTKATDLKPKSLVSDNCTITTKYTEGKPEVIVNYQSEKITNFVSGASYTIAGNVYNADSDGTIVIDETWFGSTISIIKNGIANTSINSATQGLAINSRPDAPDEISINDIKTETTKIIVEQAYNGKEYELLNEAGVVVATWISPIEGKVIFANLNEGTLYNVIVRDKAIGDTPASKKSGRVSITTQTTETKPNGVVDYKTEKITGLVANAAYSIGLESFTSDSNGTISIDEEWLGTIVAIVKKGIGLSSVDSSPQNLGFIERPAIPEDLAISLLSVGTTTLAINNADNNLKYMVVNKNGSVIKNWVSPIDEKVVFTGLSEGTEYKVIIKIGATDSTPESKGTDGTSFTTLLHEVTPSGILNYKMEAITGLVADAEYMISGTKYTADENGNIVVRNEWYGTTIEVVKPGNGITINSYAQNINILSRPSTPESVNHELISAGPNTITINPSNESLEYKLTNAEGSDVLSWVSSYEGKVIFTGLAEGTTYNVVARKKATELSPKSLAAAGTIITTQVTELTPVVKVDYHTEQLTNLIPDNSYIINTTLYTSDSNGKIVINENWYGTSVSIVKKGNGNTSADSKAQNIDIVSRPERPSSIATSNIVTGTTTITINPAYDSQEYKLKNAEGTDVKPWVSPVDGKVVFSGLTGATIYKVVTRLKATDTNSKSQETEGTAVITRFAESTPSAIADYHSAKISGLTAGASYIVSGTLYSADTGGKIAIAEEWFGNKITIVKKGNNVTSDSEPQYLNIAARPSMPAKVETDSITTEKTAITIEPAIDIQEYCLTNENDEVVKAWLSPMGGKVIFTGLTEGEVCNIVTRVKATDDVPESLTTEGIEVTTLFNESIPKGVIDYNKELISGLKSDAIYTINGTEYTADSEGNIAISESWFGTSLQIIKKGVTGSSFDSEIQTLNISQRPSVPEVVNSDKITVNRTALTITSAVENQEYKLTNANGDVVKSWMFPTDGSVIFTDLVEGVSYNVITRIKATEESPASAESKCTLVKTKYMETQPAASIDYINEKLINMVASSSYTIGKSEYSSDSDGNIAIKEEWFGTDINIVKNGDVTSSIDSTAQTLTIPARPAAPADVASSNITSEVGKLTIGSLINTQEYKVIDTFGLNIKPWTTPTGENIIFTDISNVGYYKLVTRLKATEESFCSYQTKGTSIKKNNVLETPKGIIDYTNEKVTGLLANKVYIIETTEYSSDNDGNIPINKSWFGTSINLVNKGNGTDLFDSEPQSLTIAPRPSAPGQINKDDIEIGSRSITINSTNEKVEYVIFTTAQGMIKEWALPADGKVLFSGLEEKKAYRIASRIKATENAPKSLSALSAEMSTLAISERPEYKINDQYTAITNLNPGMKYRIIYGTSRDIITADENGEIALNPYYEKTIGLVFLGDGITTGESDTVVIRVGANPSKEDNTINGTVKDSDNGVFAGASVTIKQSGNKITSVTTNNDGTFVIKDLPSGIYSIIITNSEKILTDAFEISGKGPYTLNYTMPHDSMSSILELEKNSSVIGVNGLSSILDTTVDDTEKGITAEEKAVIESGGNIEIRLRVKNNADENVEEIDAIKELADEMGVSIDSIFDFTLLKTVTSVAGVKSETIIKEVNGLMTIYADISEESQGKSDYHVFRYHNGSVDVLSTTKNKDGEYIEIVNGGKQVAMHVNKFSTYTIGYGEKANVTPTPLPSKKPTSTPIPTKAPTKDPKTNVTPLPTDNGIPAPQNSADKAAIENPVKTVSSVEMNIPSITMVKQIGYKSKFKVLLKNTSGSQITFVSSNNSIATVDKNGIISTKSKAGNVTIVLNMVKNNISSQFIIKVKVSKGYKKAYSLKSFGTSYKGLSAVLYKALTKGKSYKITLSHLKSSAKTTYSSSNKKVAVVSKSGKIRAKKAGRTNITIITKQDGITYRYFIVLRVIHKGEKTNTSYLKIYK